MYPCTHVPMYPYVLCGICTRVPLMYRSTKKVGKRPGRSIKPASFQEVSSPGEDFILGLCAICRFSSAQGNIWEGAFLPVWWSAFWQAASQWLQWLQWLIWYPLGSFRELRGAYYLASLALLTQLCTYNSAQPPYSCTLVGGKLRVA